MGASVSICNLTNVIINVALRHATPLHYQNLVIPGNCTVMKPGRVWFTVEARVWRNGTNDYNDAQVALPIAGAALIAPIVAGFGAALTAAEIGRQRKEAQTTMAPSWISGSNMTTVISTSTVNMGRVAAGTAAAGAILAVPGTAIAIAGTVINTDSSLPKEWKAEKLGVYMTPGRKINIHGGPDQKSDVQFNPSGVPRPGSKVLSQSISKDAVFHPLRIQIEK